MIKGACDGNYDDSSGYQLLIRVIGGHTTVSNNGGLILIDKSSGINSTILQNPADPDAAYRKKAGEENRGYIANVVEQGGTGCSYCGNENAKLTKGENIQLVTTDLKGTGVHDLWAAFGFKESGTELTMCAGGFIPKTNVYDRNTQKYKASFPIETCMGCPHCKECNPVMHKRVATIKPARQTAYHAQQQRFLKTDESKGLAKYRNGVETVPAALKKSIT